MRTVGRLIDLSGRFLFVLLVLAAAFVYAMFQGGKVSWTIFYVILPFVLYSAALFCYPLADLKVERTIRSSSVQKGGKLSVSITVNRRFPFPLLYTVLTEKCSSSEVSKLAGDELKQILIFGFRRKLEWGYEITNMPRGEHVFEGVEIEISDFFGWIRKTRFILESNTVLIYPKTADIHYVPIDTQYDRGSTASLFNIVKDTSMATGIRDYQSGDRVSWIHWKSFARTQTLMTKEFEDKRSQELFLILDTRPSELFEEQVELAASILKETSKHQTGIGFLTIGSEQSVFPFIQSEEQLQRALVHLAKVQPTGDDSTVMSMSSWNSHQQGGSVVLITEKPDWSFIQSVVRNAKSASTVVCFVLLKKDGHLKKSQVEDVRLAKSRGILVHTLTQGEFSEAFKEVARI